VPATVRALTTSTPYDVLRSVTPYDGLRFIAPYDGQRFIKGLTPRSVRG
jgi:hypothetical protein